MTGKSLIQSLPGAMNDGATPTNMAAYAALGGIHLNENTQEQLREIMSEARWAGSVSNHIQATAATDSMDKQQQLEAMAVNRQWRIPSRNGFASYVNACQVCLGSTDVAGQLLGPLKLSPRNL